MTDAVPERDANVVRRTIAGETILVPIRGRLADLQRVYALNTVAEFIWEHLNGERSVAELARMVAAEFDVAPERAESDVAEFSELLSRHGLLRPVAGDGAE